MPNKIFRLHQDGPVDKTDWFENKDGISNDDIDSISSVDTKGTQLPTSIPSPFARMELVREAFRSVQSDLMGDTDSHKLISDALDIGQLLFNYNRYEDQLKVISWDFQNEVESLKQSSSGQQLFGNVLDLFIQQDFEQYNFSQNDRLFLLLFREKVIGATSPITLFFASPDTVIETINIRFGNHIVLGNRPTPLVNRDKNFIKYMYSLSKSVGFSQSFSELYSYLDYSRAHIRNNDDVLFREISDLDVSYGDQFDPLTVTNTPGVLVKVKDITLRLNNPTDNEIREESGFVIKSTKKLEGNPPLVLPVDDFNEDIIYTNAKWDKAIEVPRIDPLPINQRKLPGVGDRYPYLTIGDFLEDSILRIDYSIDESAFFTANSENFLFPVKDTFFTYFKVEDIKKLLKIKKLVGNAVEVELNIPVRSKTITYRKIYKERNTLDQEGKTGKIITTSFAMCFFPLVYSEHPVDFKIGIADFSGGNEFGYKVQPALSRQNGPLKKIQFEFTERAKSADVTMKTAHLGFNEAFDCLQIQDKEENKSYLIPTFNNHGKGGKKFQFAIDFGTTNTHIEFKTDMDSNFRVFEIGEEEIQLHFLHGSTISEEQYNDLSAQLKDAIRHLKQETLPVFMGSHKTGTNGQLNQEAVKLPLRSVLFENGDVNYAHDTLTMGHVNIGFEYERFKIKNHLKPITNLKWSDKQSIENKKRINHFLEQLLFLLKNKVLLNNGDVDQTEITWFYPTSMTSFDKDFIAGVWEKLAKSVFGKNVKIKQVPESVAPFYYYNNQEGVVDMDKPVVSIDIGGGTVDAIIFKESTPLMLTSFKYAGNALFGDGFNNNIQNNGFFNKYFTKYQHYFSQNPATKVKSQILAEMEHKSSNDFVNFLLTQANSNLIEEDMHFDKLLRVDKHLKISFLVYFSSMVYHVASLMKVKDLPAPQQILFSGTASKSLKILDISPDYRNTSELFSLIFQTVYEDTTINIRIKVANEPKEVTARGGLYSKDFQQAEQIDEVLLVGGIEAFRRIQHNNRRAAEGRSQDLKYKELSEEVYEEVQQEVKAFYSHLDSIIQRINVQDKFGVSDESLALFEKLREEDLKANIMLGVNKTAAGSENEFLNETLFFYPFIALLNRLTYEASIL